MQKNKSAKKFLMPKYAKYYRKTNRSHKKVALYLDFWPRYVAAKF